MERILPRWRPLRLCILVYVYITRLYDKRVFIFTWPWKKKRKIKALPYFSTFCRTKRIYVCESEKIMQRRLYRILFRKESVYLSGSSSWFVFGDRFGLGWKLYRNVIPAVAWFGFKIYRLEISTFPRARWINPEPVSLHSYLAALGNPFVPYSCLAGPVAQMSIVKAQKYNTDIVS